VTAVGLGWLPRSDQTWLRVGRVVMVGFISLLWVRELATTAPQGAVADAWGFGALTVLTLSWSWFWLMLAGYADTWRNALVVLIGVVCAVIAITAFPSGVVPFYFVAVLAGASYRWQVASLLVAAMTVLSAVLLFVHHLRTVSDAQEVVVVAALGAAAIIVRQLVGARAELEASQAEIRHLAAVDARARFAQDLHDKLGQQLTVAVMQGELLSMDLADADLPELEARSKILVDSTRHSLELMRELVTSVRTGGLASELELAAQTLEASRMSLTVSVSGGPLTPSTDVAFGWVVREAITNVLRHSRAHHVAITVQTSDHEQSLAITDDGVGVAHVTPGNGLAGISDRIAELGGSVAIGAQADRGFSITAKVPVTS